MVFSHFSSTRGQLNKSINSPGGRAYGHLRPLAATCIRQQAARGPFGLWSKAWHFSIALSRGAGPTALAKGAKTTTWIWNLHSDAHDFCMQQGSALVTRKIFSSNLAHLSLVFFWLGGMHFHAAYFANTHAWNKDPKHCLPSAHTVSSLVGQDILNSDVGGYFQGINITSGFFQLWRSEGIVTEIHLKYACTASLIGTIACMGGSYFHMHIGPLSSIGLRQKSLSLSVHHLSLLLGLASMSWSGHQIHISLPLNRLLDSGVDPAVIPWPQDLLFRDSVQVIVPSFGSGPLVDFSLRAASAPFGSLNEGVSILGRSLNPSTAAKHLGVLGAHHLYVALVFIGSGLIAYAAWPLNHLSNTPSALETACYSGPLGAAGLTASHPSLSISLLLAGSSSLVFASHVYAMPVYPYLASDYPTVLSLFCHHINIGSLLTIGAGAHASIGMIRDLRTNACSNNHILENLSSSPASSHGPKRAIDCVGAAKGEGFSYQGGWAYRGAGPTRGPGLRPLAGGPGLRPLAAICGPCNRLQKVHICIEVLNHRCIVVAHLIYLSVALALHSFGLYIHNDTLQSLGRPQDMFADNSIGLKPVAAALLSSFRVVSFDIEVLDGKVATLTQELGTADFMVHHIHAFTIHVTLLILCKAFLYARSSRLVSDKLELGYRYPCDGPGRGGTCQISPYDHLYLAIFWMYNSLSVVLFHYFWKMQSDVWGTLRSPASLNQALGPRSAAYQKISHISGGDFSVNSGTINGWLRNFLWSQAAQVIQSYGTSISAYGLIFLCAHFVWAFSLMFLYSGRAYWQELIESILWAHHKLKIVNVVSPRALSISQGRAVGLTHYVLGGLGTTWAFVLSRMIALS